MVLLDAEVECIEGMIANFQSDFFYDVLNGNFEPDYNYSGPERILLYLFQQKGPLISVRVASFFLGSIDIVATVNSLIDDGIEIELVSYNGSQYYKYTEKGY